MTTQNDYDDAPRPREPKRRRPLRTTVLVLLGVVLALAALVAGYVISLAVAFETRTTTIEPAFPDASTRPERTAAAEGAMNILLMGSDARPGESADAGNPGEGSADTRSDTMMLLHIPEDRQTVYVMSIMRDTWTEIPGHGDNKINAAIALGGVPLVVQTVETMFDAPVDHVVMLDFEGFKGLTDALGGVTVDNPIAFRSEGTEGEEFQQGSITLDGESALKFVRERQAFSDGDYQRVQNQQLFIKGVMSELLSTETFTNPVRLSRVVNEISPYLSVDEDFDAVTLGSLALGMRQVRSDDVVFFTLPNLGVGTAPDGQSIVVKDDEAIGRIAEALDQGTLGEYVASTPAQ
ncbi:cell envelope-related function transcriptional attenuator common domain-containing protein [Arthrobacter subterraneus]|uniref:Cell envelope-related function transcriptional attenuator common domain-containing protein n=1 Tax=Arthrobacter subterraneus TaxID=335973 RepID=A0A1G8FJ22_9MICC|nr:LCP family protein [Arthrobacter subterraneus]SDH82173.1 cell envelope-related function transcriptional attenuator common domain-containing protein [Arthrobacter subterraneus]